MGTLGSGFAKWFLALALAVSLTACSEQELHRDLSEGQANEVVAVLSEAGISASKQAMEDNVWSVAVTQDDFARSVQLLRANGLPRQTYDNLGSVFKKEGFTSSPLEERARLIYGLSQELSHTISEIDGVVQSRVHLTLPEPDPLSREVKPSSASVFIKYRPGFDLDNQTSSVKSLVANSIEGLTYEKVSVVMVPGKAIAQPVEAAWSPHFGWLRWIAIVGAVGLTLFAVWQFVKTRRRDSARNLSSQSDPITEKAYASNKRN